MSGPVETEGGGPGVPVPDGTEHGDAEPGQAPPQPHLDRRAALAQGAPGIPANFVFWVLGAVLVLSLGGLVGEHLFSSAGLNPTTTTTTAPAPRAASLAPAPVPASDRSVRAPLAAFMGLSTPHPTQAPAFSLRDQGGRSITVPPQPPRALVLTFFNAACNDICPVLASELEQADADLGTRAAQVEFVTVNTDPTALAQSAEAPVVGGSGLGTLANWHIVTGPLATLNAIWKDYGISISVSPKTGLEAHNDVMDFISPGGQVVYRATPFADESASGAYSSPAATVSRWGQGIATYAERALGQ